MITTNFHTHTVFCDAIDTPEEMILTAIEKGFTSLGFSSHSYFEPEAELSMPEEKYDQYINEILTLKEKYKDKIKIFCGIEQDIYSNKTNHKFEYMIGSVHNLYKDGNYIDVDLSAERTKENIDTYYNGDFDSFAEHYFETVSKVLEVTNADIIGHIDLVSKFNEKLGFTESERYLKAAEKAVKKLVGYGKPFEINTGAMSRGAKSIPYPSPAILKMIKENGGKIAFSSDCHNRLYLDYAFDKAEELARNAGFTEHGIITENGIEYVAF